ncbi:hypothetical protein HRbin30_03105 [bacterium HR30]|nr:hypothetical protein HRbin30_03105 [bacterium HR30]
MGWPPSLQLSFAHSDPLLYCYPNQDAHTHADGHGNCNCDSKQDPDADLYEHAYEVGDGHTNAVPHEHPDRHALAHPDSLSFPNRDSHGDFLANGHTESNTLAYGYSFFHRVSHANRYGNADAHKKRDTFPHAQPNANQHCDAYVDTNTNALPEHDAYSHSYRSPNGKGDNDTHTYALDDETPLARFHSFFLSHATKYGNAIAHRRKYAHRNAANVSNPDTFLPPDFHGLSDGDTHSTAGFANTDGNGIRDYHRNADPHGEPHAKSLDLRNAKSYPFALAHCLRHKDSNEHRNHDPFSN